MIVKVRGYARLFKSYRECYDDNDLSNRVIEESIEVEDSCLFETAEDAIANSDGIFPDREYLGEPVLIEHEFEVDCDCMISEATIPTIYISPITEKHLENPNVKWIDFKTDPNQLIKELEEEDIDYSNIEFEEDCPHEFGKDWLGYGNCPDCDLSETLCKREFIRLQTERDIERKKLEPPKKPPVKLTIIKLQPRFNKNSEDNYKTYYFMGEMPDKLNHYWIQNSTEPSERIFYIHLEDIYIPEDK